MPDIHYLCPACEQVASAPARAAGKTRPCPHCAAAAVVPRPAEEEPAARLDFPAPGPATPAQAARSRRALRKLSAARIVI